METIIEFLKTKGIEGQQAKTIAQWFEEYQTLNTKKVKKTPLEKQMDILKEWFEKYPFMVKVALGAMGTFYKYECAGETYTFDSSNFNRIDRDYKANPYHKDYSEDALDKAIDDDLFADIEIEDFFTKTPERGGKKVIAYNTNGEIIITFETYDPE